MNRRYKETDIYEVVGRKIFFDANVLIYLFFTVGENKRIKLYSDLFSKIKSAKNECIIDFVVLSEIINRAHRIDYNLYLVKKGTKLNYKEFRNTEEGKKSLETIYYMVENIILLQFVLDGKICTTEDALSYLSVDSMDFNDKFIAALCQEKGYILLTDDVDFRLIDVEILSANSNLTKQS